MTAVVDGSLGFTSPSGAIYNGLQTATAVASTSGTSIDFTNIPSWVKRITIMLNAVSTNSGSNYMIQLGTPSIATSGYTSLMTTAQGTTVGIGTYTNGFNYTNPSGSGASMFGHCVITNISGNNWVFSSNVGDYSGPRAFWTQGSIGLSGALTVVRFTTNNGTDTFDAGTVNIIYE